MIVLQVSLSIPIFKISCGRLIKVRQNKQAKNILTSAFCLFPLMNFEFLVLLAKSSSDSQGSFDNAVFPRLYSVTSWPYRYVNISGDNCSKC